MIGNQRIALLNLSNISYFREKKRIDLQALKTAN